MGVGFPKGRWADPFSELAGGAGKAPGDKTSEVVGVEHLCAQGLMSTWCPCVRRVTWQRLEAASVKERATRPGNQAEDGLMHRVARAMTRLARKRNERNTVPGDTLALAFLDARPCPL